MIHGYEFILPSWYKDYLVLYLHKKLLKKLGREKLNRIIRVNRMITFNIEKGKPHSLLLLLKSIQLDLIRRNDLGTIRGYELDEALKVYPKNDGKRS